MNKVTPIPGFAPPTFVQAARAEFDALRKAHPDLKYVDVVLADVIGILRGKRMPIAEASKLFETGMQIPHSIYLMDANGEMTNPLERGYGDGDPDGTAWPIPKTLTRVWGEGPARAQMLMTLRDENGVADPAEPRAALERVLER
jgi:glutamine synthetase